MSGALHGMGIVITRPRAAAEALATELAALGARPFVFPALGIEPLPESPALAAALDRLPRAAFAIFVSANAAQMGLAAVRRRGDWPRGPRIAAVGEATAQALRNHGMGPVISPTGRQDSEGLLALEALASVGGMDIVIFRGDGGRERLREGLEARGARVTYAECYRRVKPDADPAELLLAWSRREIHAVSALSTETLANFLDAVGEAGRALARETTLVVPHEAIAGSAPARAFGRVRVSGAGADGIAAALQPPGTSP